MPASAVLDRLEIHEDGTIEAECGLLLSRLSTAARDACLTGLEFAQGIPGTVGGAVYMNAGAYDGEMSRFVASSEWISEDGRSGVVAGSAHDFGYRRSMYSQKPGLYVLKATLRLSPGSKADISAKMADYRARRQASQPLDMPSAGSVFKRPEGHYTGKLISDLGLKGYAIGGAQISEKHAGFIINTGGATCADVLALIDYICTEVDKAYGVRLEREVKVIGG